MHFQSWSCTATAGVAVADLELESESELKMGGPLTRGVTCLVFCFDMELPLLLAFPLHWVRGFLDGDCGVGGDGEGSGSISVCDITD